MITFDNDMAFCFHKDVGKELGANTYFTRPYASQDKGTVENRIGVIRRFIPKKTEHHLLTHKEISRVEKIFEQSTSTEI
jgi:IS30 family transposase